MDITADIKELCDTADIKTKHPRPLLLLAIAHAKQVQAAAIANGDLDAADKAGRDLEILLRVQRGEQFGDEIPPLEQPAQGSKVSNPGAPPKR